MYNEGELQLVCHLIRDLLNDLSWLLVMNAPNITNKKYTVVVYIEREDRAKDRCSQQKNEVIIRFFFFNSQQKKENHSKCKDYHYKRHLWRKIVKTDRYLNSRFCMFNNCKNSTIPMHCERETINNALFWVEAFVAYSTSCWLGRCN